MEQILNQLPKLAIDSIMAQCSETISTVFDNVINQLCDSSSSSSDSIIPPSPSIFSPASLSHSFDIMVDYYSELHKKIQESEKDSLSTTGKTYLLPYQSYVNFALCQRRKNWRKGTLFRRCPSSSLC